MKRTAAVLALVPSACLLAPRGATAAGAYPWRAVKVRRDQRNHVFVYSKTEVKRVPSDAPFTQQFPLYTAEPGPNGTMTIKPTELALRLTAKTADGQAKVVKAADGSEWAKVGSYSEIGVEVAATFGLPAGSQPRFATAAAPAPAPAQEGAFGEYEKQLISSVLTTTEKAQCETDPKTCRGKLVDVLSTHVRKMTKDGKPVDLALDELETGYLKARLGEQGYAKLQEKLKAGALKPADVRAKMFAEIAAYGQAPNQSAYQPDATNVSVAALVAPPKEPPHEHAETKADKTTPLGDVLYKQFLRKYGVKDFPLHEREYDMTFAYFKDRPEAADMIKKLTDEEKAGKTDALSGYIASAQAAAREQILKPASPSPFGRNSESDLLDAYCDALARKDAALGPAPTSCPKPATAARDEVPLEGELRASARNPNGAFDKNPQCAPAAGDAQNNPQAAIDKKCEPWLEKHKATRAAMDIPREQPNDGLVTTNVPTTSSDCPEAHCKETKEPGPNDKLPWEMGVAWGAAALIALGILTGGIGFGVIAGVAAATMVGWYVGKEANR